MRPTRHAARLALPLAAVILAGPLAGELPPADEAGGALADAALAAASEAIELERTGDALAWLDLVPAAERGWVWHWLAAQADRSAAVLLDAGAPIAAFAVSPDGRRLAAATGDGRLLLLGETDAEARSLRTSDEEAPAEPEAARALAFSPDGARLALALRDGTVTIRDFGSGEESQRWRVEAAGTGAVAWSPQGDRIAVGGFRRDPESGRPVGFLELRALDGTLVTEVEPSAFFVGAVAFSPDGDTLVAGGPQGRLDVMDVSGEAPPRRLEITDSAGFPQVHDLAFSPDGSHLAAGCDDGTVRLWETGTWTEERLPGAPPDHRAAVYAVAFDRTGERLLSGGADLALRIRSLAGDEPKRSLLGSVTPIVALGFNEGGTPLTVSADGVVRTWQGSGAEPRLSDGESVWGLAWSADGSRVATADAAGRVRIWDPATGSVLREIAAHEGDGVGVLFTDGGRRLVSTGNDGGLRIWRADDGTRIAELEDVDDGRGVALSLSPDGATLAAGSSTGEVKLWDLASGTVRHVLSGHEDEVWRALWTPDGESLVTVAADGEVVVWDAAAGAEVRRWSAHEGAIHGAALSPDGARLATASVDRAVRLWELATGRRLGELRGHTGRVWDVAWSPDGHTLASVSNDYTLRLWNAATGRPLVVRHYPIQVYLARWSPDGRTLAVVPFSGEVDLLTPP